VDIVLLKKYFDNKCTHEEAKQVLDWINSPEGKREVFNYVVHYDQISGDEKIDSNDLLQRLHSRIKSELHTKDDSSIHYARPYQIDNRKSGKRLFRWGIAATIVLFFISAIGIYLFTYEQNVDPVQQLHVSDKVVKSTGKGQKLTIHLSDGSKVILNAASKITYSRQFSDSLRSVNVEGEAYFEIAEDVQRPFIVNTGNIQTQALGTAFNVLYRKEFDQQNIALVSGKVKVTHASQEVNSVILEPGEMVSVNSANQNFDKSEFDVELVTAWKNSVLRFKEAGFIEVIRTLEYWYGVEIDWSGKLKEDWKFSAKFENENLRNVLNALEYAQEFDYSMQDEYVKIKLK